MKTKLIIGTSIVIGTLFLLSFTNRGEEQARRTEEYAFIIYNSNSTLEKTANGKTEIIKLVSEKIDGVVGKYDNNSLVAELNKMNADGYEIVNVSATVTGGSFIREVYLFRRKI